MIEVLTLLLYERLGIIQWIMHLALRWYYPSDKPHYYHKITCTSLFCIIKDDKVTHLSNVHRYKNHLFDMKW